MTRYWVRGLGAWLVRHPRDVGCVVRASWRLRRRHWWRRFPGLPLPAPAYWEFRLMTALGEDGVMSPADVVSVARWSVQQDVRR